MADTIGGGISLHSPDPRGIIDLAEFHVPDSLAKTVRSGRYEIRINTAFEEVVLGCAEREETWISAAIAESYIQLHRMGHAHSVEAWGQEHLSGGLYGVAIGAAFFGESMFSIGRDASKVALVALVGRMRARGMTLLDTQWTTPHLARFGGREIPRNEYMLRLDDALRREAVFWP